MRCPVETLYLLHMMRSRTKSFLCTGVCLVYCSDGAISLVSPDGAPPSGGFCTSEPVNGSRSGGGGLGAGGRAFRAGSGPPRFRPGWQPPPARALLHFASTALLCQGHGLVCWPGRFRTVSHTTGAVFWRALSELLREPVCECPILASGVWQSGRPPLPSGLSLCGGHRHDQQTIRPDPQWVPTSTVQP